MSDVSISAKGVYIDGMEYVPRNTVISAASLKNLAEVYSISWCNGRYDPVDHSASTKFLAEISDLIMEVNQELHFKR